MYSQKFSQLYDVLMGNNPHILTSATQLVTEYVPKQGSILELGCGTGTMLQQLEKDYQLSGIDNAPGMIEIARKKVPSATYYVDDMVSFTLSKKFDAILCLFDSINHLTTFTQWKKMFEQVHKHLKKNGVFIFDINTITRLEKLAQFPTKAMKPTPSTLAAVKITKQKTHHFFVKFQIFEDLNKPEVKYFEESVYESAFSTASIKKTLLPNFSIEKMVDPFRPKINKETGRIFFVCTKK